MSPSVYKNNVKTAACKTINFPALLARLIVELFENVENLTEPARNMR